MRHWPVAAATGLGALAVFGAAASPAAALTPTRTAWWNEAPLGLVISPSPVQSDQLLVAEGTAGPDAMAAVYYSVAGSSGAGSAPMSASATLRLPLDTNSSVGTPAVQACPIRPSAAGWQKGGNQTGAPPAYDCSNGSGVPGQVASDGTSVVFTLTPAQQQTGSPGVFDLALVPTTQMPFQAVFDQPGNSDFTVTSPSAGTSTQGAGGASGTSGSPAGSGAGQGQGTGGTGSGTSGSGTSGSGTGASGTDTSGLATSSSDFGAGDLSSTSALAAPSLPSPSGTSGTGSGSATSGSTQVAAGALRPTAATGSGSGSRSGGLFGGRREQLLGVWLLVDAGLVLYMFGSDLERAPRLLGSVAARRGLARAAAVEEGAGEDAGAAPAQVGGLGRFARPRTEPARRLY